MHCICAAMAIIRFNLLRDLNKQQETSKTCITVVLFWIPTNFKRNLKLKLFWFTSFTSFIHVLFTY